MCQQMTYWEAAINERSRRCANVGVRDLPTVLAHFARFSRVTERQIASTGTLERTIPPVQGRRAEDFTSWRRCGDRSPANSRSEADRKRSVIHAAAPSTVPGLALPEHRCPSAARGKWELP